MKILNSIIKWSRSRTVWSIAVLFVLGGVKQISDFLPNDIYTLSQAVLSALAIYFRSNPRVK